MWFVLERRVAIRAERGDELKQEIPLRQRELFGRLAGEGFAVGGHLVGFRVDGDRGGGVVELHVALAQPAAVADGLDALRQAVAGDGVERRAADEGDARAAGRAAEA